jgi:hypothetical protein
MRDGLTVVGAAGIGRGTNVIASLRVETMAMDILNKEHLKMLMSQRPWPCVSIFLPTHQAGQEIRQDL